MTVLTSSQEVTATSCRDGNLAYICANYDICTRFITMESSLCPSTQDSDSVTVVPDVSAYTESSTAYLGLAWGRQYDARSILPAIATADTGVQAEDEDSTGYSTRDSVSIYPASHAGHITIDLTLNDVGPTEHSEEDQLSFSAIATSDTGIQTRGSPGYYNTRDYITVNPTTSTNPSSVLTAGPITTNTVGTVESEQENQHTRRGINTEEIRVKPTIRSFPVNVTARPGDTVELSCGAYGAPNSIGRDGSNINISRNEPPNGHDVHQKDFALADTATRSKISLTIPILSVNISHEGWWSCKACNYDGCDEKFAYLRVEDLCDGVDCPDNTACVADYDNHNYSCKFCNEKEQGTRDKVCTNYCETKFNKCYMFIDALEEGKDGVEVAYKGSCQSTVSPEIQLENSTSGTVNLIEGDTLVLECYVTGTPEPTITWYKEGGNEPVASGERFEKIVSVDDTGLYYCAAINCKSNTVRGENIYVSAVPDLCEGVNCLDPSVCVPDHVTHSYSCVCPPSASLEILLGNSTSGTVNLIEGDTLVLECYVTGKPEPTITWYKEGSSEPVAIGYEIQSLRLEKTVTVDDAGSYYCHAINCNSNNTAKGGIIDVSVTIKTFTPMITSSPSITTQYYVLEVDTIIAPDPPYLAAHSTCQVFGDPHVLTYDLNSYDFAGRCDYVLAMDCQMARWFIYGRMRPCGTHGGSCLETVTVYLNSEIVEMQRGWLINQYGSKLHPKNHIGEETPIGDQEEITLYFDGAILEVSALLQERELANGTMEQDKIVVRWDGYVSVHIQTPKTARTCGMCGNNDGNSTNDMRTRWQRYTDNAAVFGESWKVDRDNTCEHAPDPVTLAQACGDRLANVTAQCEDIFNIPQFQQCETIGHNKTEFIKACIYDECEGLMQQDCLPPKCMIAQAYATRCSSPYWWGPGPLDKKQYDLGKTDWRAAAGCRPPKEIEPCIVAQGCPQPPY